jgi:hypothetical protein
MYLFVRLSLLQPAPYLCLKLSWDRSACRALPDSCACESAQACLRLIWGVGRTAVPTLYMITEVVDKLLLLVAMMLQGQCMGKNSFPF